jgi:hypothetical protein
MSFRILFIDSDYVLNAYQAWQTMKWDIAGGRVIPYYLSPPPNWLLNMPNVIVKGPLGIHDHGDNNLECGKALPITANLLLSRKALCKIGAFSEDLGRVGASLRSGEDTNFCERALNLNMRIGYCSSCIASHIVPPQRMTRRYFLQWYYMFGLSSNNEMLPHDTVFWFRTPRFEWRRLFVSAFRLLFSLVAGCRFENLLHFVSTSGSVIGYLTTQKRFTLTTGTDFIEKV